MNIPHEGSALLAFLKASLSGIPSDPERLPSAIDWFFLQRMARRHRLGPLLHDGFRRSLFVGVPDWLWTDWEAQYREAVALALYHRGALAEIAAVFEDRGVPFILLKGEALSKDLYPRDGLRPYYDDIDLLIQSGSYETAKAILMGLSFRLRRPSEEAEKRRLFGEIEFDREGVRTLTVDLHWDTLMASWERQSLFKEHHTWASLHRVQVGNRAVPVLGDEALLLYLCIHFAFHHVFDGLIHLCDLFLLLSRDAERLDWGRLLAMAARCQCQHALYFSLVFVKALLAAQVPPGILERLRPSAPIRTLMPTSRLPFRATPVPQLLERYVKFLLIDTQEGRWGALRAWLQSSKPFLGR
jgi:hypothetical protein